LFVISHWLSVFVLFKTSSFGYFFIWIGFE